MKPPKERITELTRKQTKVEEMGGDTQVAKQHDKGKLTARERIALFFDEGTFAEIDALVEHRSTNF